MPMALQVSKLNKQENQDPIIPAFNTPENKFNLSFGCNNASIKLPQFLKVRGNKTLMEGLQNVIKTEVIIKKAQIIEDVDKNLIDPKMKDLITPENELKQQMEDETKIDLDDDLF